MEEMLKRGLSIGGEQSGHIIFSDHLFTGDGIVTALNVLRVMARHRPRAGDLAGELVTYPQVLVNVRVREKKRSRSGAGDRGGDGAGRDSGSPARAGCSSASRAPSRSCGSCSKGRTSRRSSRLGAGHRGRGRRSTSDDARARRRS